MNATERDTPPTTVTIGPFLLPPFSLSCPLSLPSSRPPCVAQATFGHTSRVTILSEGGSRFVSVPFVGPSARALPLVPSPLSHPPAPLSCAPPRAFPHAPPSLRRGLLCPPSCAPSPLRPSLMHP